MRDDITRALHAHASPETAAAATFVGGLLITSLWARRVPSRAELRSLAPAAVGALCVVAGGGADRARAVTSDLL